MSDPTYLQRVSEAAEVWKRQSAGIVDANSRRQIRALVAVLVTVDTQCMEKDLVQRFVVVGLIAGAVVGGLVGLGIGLHVYAPTAWFAVFEVGVPVAVAGGCVGLVAASGLKFARRVRH